MHSPTFTANYSWFGSSLGVDALVNHFPPETEHWYLFFLSLGVFSAIPAHALIIFIAVFKTPREMVNYRLTVTNTSVWSLLVVIHSGLLVRPVPLFPLAIAKTAGLFSVFGDVWGGQIQLIVLMVLITNFLTASVICFLVICLFLLQNRFRTMFSRRVGIVTAICTHLLMTLIVLFFFAYVYRPSHDLKSQLVLDYGTGALKGLIDEDTVIFGYYDFNRKKHQVLKPEFLAVAIFTMFSVVVVIVLILYAMLIKQIWHAINKTSVKETNRTRRAVVFMLTSRTIIPLTFGFIPVMIISFSLHFGLWLSFKVYCTLLCTAISHGLINCVCTIIVFAPYRRAYLKLLYRFLPLSISHKIGLADYMEDTSWQESRNKINKTTSRVHTTNTSVYILKEDPSEKQKASTHNPI